jgi:hypothetical protein
MNSFKQYLKECMEGEGLLPTITGTDEAVDFFDPSQREATNFVLSDITDESQTYPAVVYEKVRSVLIGLGYSIPPVTDNPLLFGESEGEEIFGMTRPLPADSPEPDICYLYFAFCQVEDTTTYDVLAEIVTQEELEDILSEE